MFSGNIDVRIIQLNNPRERQEVEGFLLEQGLSLENDADYTIGLYDNDKIIGTGSLSDKVLKSIAIDSSYQGAGLSNRIVSLLVNEQYHRGNTHLFIFTKPENVSMFHDMGFYEIATVEGVSLLENDINGIKRYTDSLSMEKKDGNVISSIVMNCNPFTLGHRYLIEQASLNSDYVHIFVVWEDKSIFPSETRYNLVKEGTKDLPNIILHKGKDYVISNSTFPSYFLKDTGNVVKAHAMLDLKIFGQYIGPSLGINRRYIGEEPYCTVTQKYNKTMKELLLNYDIEVIEIPRLKNKDVSISASGVRGFIKKNRLSDLKDIVPKVTYDFLQSNEGKRIIDKIKNEK